MLKCQISADSPKCVYRGQRAVDKESHKVRQRSVTVTAVGTSYSRHSAGTISCLITILKVRYYYVHLQIWKLRMRKIKGFVQDYTAK